MLNKVNNALPVKPPSNLWGNGKNNKNEKANESFKIDKFEAPKAKQAPVLSEAAQSLLDQLKEKYGNVYFIVAEFSSDSEAQRHLRQGKGEINCVITPALLEKMAADEGVRAKYEGLIEESIGGVEQVKEAVDTSDKADLVKSYGISVDSNGQINYYVMLRDGLPNNINEGSKMVKAGSIEELLKKLEEIDEERRLEKSREKRKEKLNIEV